jgi:uncharacterized coiled-coil protein SlyX
MSKAQSKLKASIDRIEIKIANLVKSINELETKVSEQTDELNGFRLLAQNKALIKRLDNIGKRMLALTIKDAVATEVALCYPSSAAAILRLRDESDEFWIERDRWTIDDWAKYIFDIERGAYA